MKISMDQMRPLRAKRDVLSANGRTTRWLGIAAALRSGLESGRFAAGEALPSTRELARSFGVHRHTVLIALDALVAEGLVQAEARRAYYVCPRQPGAVVVPEVPTPLRFAGFRLVRGKEPAPESQLPPATIPLHAAVPDTTLLPLAELRAAYSHVLRRHAHSALATVDERGLPALRRELARYVRRARGLLPKDMIVTQGSQEAIALAAQVLLQPGDTVLVEDPGYAQAVRAFAQLGARIVPLPVDSQGLRVDELGRWLARGRARLLYTTPNHHYPTTVTLSAPRRSALLQLTLQHGVAVLEDDYDHEYHYRGAAQAPLAASSRAPHVVYVGTLSKLVAPGVRIGFACADRSLIEAMVQVRRLVTRGNDGVTQAALADWMADGGLDRHVRRARRVYATRREAALGALERAAGEVALEYTPPDGGLAIWTVWPKLDVLDLVRNAAARGVWALPEPLVSSRRRGHGMRLAFGGVTPAQFEAGLAILVSEAQRLVAKGRVREKRKRA